MSLATACYCTQYVTFRCKSVHHLEFLKFKIYDIRQSLWLDYASLYKIFRQRAIVERGRVHIGHKRTAREFITLKRKQSTNR